MTLDPNIWYVKWFLWSCEVIDRFWLTSEGRFFDSRLEKYQYGTNLCHFFRTLMWGFLIFLFVISLYVYGVFVLFILPFIVFSAYSIVFGLEIVGICLVALTIIVGCLWFLYKGWQKIWHSYLDYLNERALHPIDENASPGFFKLLLNYYKAVKQRICPILNFGEPKPVRPIQEYDGKNYVPNPDAATDSPVKEENGDTNV